MKISTLKRGQRQAVAKRRRIGADTDERIARAVADGVPADPYALAARLPGMTYARARYALIRLGLWKPRSRQKS